ncbi:3',5'-cyclic-nucleotide phosphodiesterase [Parachitinimonas caeni]|uniref:3',5'-cyclic-nucleotide phosphodiesterase n=1 Tax=Parachitinimonas caeni TaxID=3031301 RepID=A0ABT7DT35_9NEIS|nr:3',5'-cyclic-nucleotide phosphodiesterase [Parachitinimonas caeni]MDK2123217.1 3',5'-cyclic-nucleotide phosphodiesterase [Parachitinimonas caeni]
MRVKILGCSGGIGGTLRTTSMLLDGKILIDAGTGVGDLSVAELAAIDHIFITHAHLDHVAMLPLLVDTVGALRTSPIVVHASQATLDILKAHIFNWLIWPDFSEIPSVQAPFMQFAAFEEGEVFPLDGGGRIVALPALHTVPAVGYQLDSGAASLVFSGDTTVNDAFWPVVNAITNLRYLIIETAFCNREIKLAEASKHLCPSMLADELSKLHRPAEVFITHLKPGEIELTMQEIGQDASQHSPQMLYNSQIFDF